MLFEFGRTLITPGAQQTLNKAWQEPVEFLDRYAMGDWGNLEDEDKQANQYALNSGLRIFASYITSAGDKIWIITEADRSATTILLPEEY